MWDGRTQVRDLSRKQLKTKFRREVRNSRARAAWEKCKWPFRNPPSLSATHCVILRSLLIRWNSNLFPCLPTIYMTKGITLKQKKLIRIAKPLRNFPGSIDGKFGGNRGLITFLARFLRDKVVWNSIFVINYMYIESLRLCYIPGWRKCRFH